MTTYEPMACRVCGRSIEPRDPALDPAEPWVYRCACGWSYSNARRAAVRRAIAPSPKANVPPEVSAELERALAHAANVRNRPEKATSFRSEASQDAVTWTVFRFLTELSLLDAVAGIAGERAAPGDAVVLFWGVPVPEARDHLVASTLGRVSRDDLREHPQSRSEPDVIIAWPDLLVVAEAKYTSPNTVDRYAAFEPYVEGAPELFTGGPADVARGGFYELVRNWRIAHDLARRLAIRRLVLLNIGAHRAGEQFRASVVETPQRHFASAEWRDVVAAARARLGVLPPWFARYVEARGLEAARPGPRKSAPVPA